MQKMMRGISAYLGTLAVVLTAGLSSRADDVTVTATFNGSQPNTVETLLKSNYNDSDNGLSTTTVDTVAGVYNFTLQAYTGSETSTPLKLSEVTKALGSPGDIFHAVCIDFTHNVWYNQPNITWKVEDLSSVGSPINGVGISGDQAKAIAYLWQHSPQLNASDDATLQMAVWDLIYNGGGTYSLVTGSGSHVAGENAPTVSYPGGTAPGLHLDVTAASDAAYAWTHRLDSGTRAVYALVNTNGPQNGPAYQSFDFAIVTAPVPLPASVGEISGMLLGFGALFGIRNRLKRRSRIA